MTTDVTSAMQAKRESVVNEHIEAETIRHDVAATVKTFKHPRYEVPASGTVADGAVAVTQLLGVLLTAFPDFHLERTQFRHAEDAVIVECRLVGAQRGVWSVFGYACGLDMTRRDLQCAARDKKRPWDTGKDFESSAVIAPIVPGSRCGRLGHTFVLER